MCPNYVQAENIERIRKENKISYADGVKWVEDDVSGARQVYAEPMSWDPIRANYSSASDDSVIS